MIKRVISRNFNFTKNSTAIVIKPPNYYENFKENYLKEKFSPMRLLTNNEKINLVNDIEEKENLERFNNKFNEKNPLNHCKVLIRQPEEVKEENEDLPFFIKKNPREKKNIFKISMNKIPISLKKLKPFLKRITGMNILCAISKLNSSDKKSCKLLIKALEKCLATSKRYDMKPEQIWVQSIVVGKDTRKKKIYYHARGRHGIINSDTTKLKLFYYSKSVDELFELFATGKTPISLSYMIRKEAEEKELSYEKIKEFNFLFTSKGRQQKVLMIKRRAMQLKLFYKSKGYSIPFQILLEYVKNLEKDNFIEKYKENFINKPKLSIIERKQIFEENQKSLN